MLPALIKPSTSCIIPAISPAQRNNSNAPSSVMADNTMAANPAAGPDTEMLEFEMEPITIPPIIPAIIPDSGGAPDANAIPKHSGSATKNTTTPEGKFSFTPPNIFFAFFIFF